VVRSAFRLMAFSLRLVDALRAQVVHRNIWKHAYGMTGRSPWGNLRGNVHGVVGSISKTRLLGQPMGRWAMRIG